MESAPNLKPFEEPPNLKESVEAEPVELCSVEAPPNLNAPEELSEDELPNLKPEEVEVESDEALPNLKDDDEVGLEKEPPNFNSLEAEFKVVGGAPNLKEVEVEFMLKDCLAKPEETQSASYKMA